jgi:nucleotide-binding universal stress UspA family protein
MATLFAHHYAGLPQAVSVQSPAAHEKGQGPGNGVAALFSKIRKEVGSLGYEVDTRVIGHESVAGGILAAAHAQKTWAIVLGHPLGGSVNEFKYVVDTVAREAPCPVIVVRFAGVLHTERILVPVIDMEELNTLSGVIHSLSGVGSHAITLLGMVQPDAFEEEVEEAEEALREWVADESLSSSVLCRAVATEARLGAIVDETCRHDLVVMAATHNRGLRRLFFGSVAEDVAQCCQRPMLIVYGKGIQD